MGILIRRSHRMAGKWLFLLLFFDLQFFGYVLLIEHNKRTTCFCAETIAKFRARARAEHALWLPSFFFFFCRRPVASRLDAAFTMRIMATLEHSQGPPPVHSKQLSVPNALPPLINLKRPCFCVY